MSSFFVVSKQYEELARDEIISISKSYDDTTKVTVLPRLVMVSSKVPWDTIAKRATFARQAGTILAKKWGSKVSLSNPQVTVYLIITDYKNYLGYADSQVMPLHPKKL